MLGLRISDAPSRPAAVGLFGLTVLVLWGAQLIWLFWGEAHYQSHLNLQTILWIGGYCYFTLNTTQGFCLRLLGAMTRHPKVLPELEVEPRCLVALACPIYREDTAKLDVRLHATLRGNFGSNVVFWLLSDSPPQFEERELKLIDKLRASFPDRSTDIRYRRRIKNVDSKSGNMTDFLINHGGYDFDYILVIDCDSLLTAGVISRLVKKAEHPANRNVFLFQAKISIYNAHSRWARFAEIGNRIGNRLDIQALFRGQSTSWGHNCLIRTHVIRQQENYTERQGSGRNAKIISRPLPTQEPSHDVFDFVYGSMLGYSAQYVNDVETFEETPSTTHVSFSRSQRWARGSLSALKLIFEKHASLYARFLAWNGGASFLNCTFIFWLFLSFWLAANPEQLNIFFENNIAFGLIETNRALLGTCGVSLLTYFAFPFLAASSALPMRSIVWHLLISNAIVMHELCNGVYILIKTLTPWEGWTPMGAVVTSRWAQLSAGLPCSFISAVALGLLLSGGPLQWWAIVALPMLLGGLFCPLVIHYLNSIPSHQQMP